MTTTWVLCNDVGTNSYDVTDAAGKNITFQRNGYHEARLTLGHRTSAAAALWTLLLTDGVPTLQVYRNQTLVFNGGLAPFTETYDDNSGQLSLIFRSSFARLVGYGAGNGPALLEALSYSSAEQTAIASDLVTLAVSTWTLPVALGTVTSSGVGRTIDFRAGEQIGQCIQTLANAANGLEFLDRPTSGPGVQGLIDIGPSFGATKAATKFEYGPETMRNLGAFGRTVGMPVNVAHVVGGNGLIGAAGDSTSRTLYGDYVAVESRPDITDSGLLNARASAMLRGKPPRIVTFTPDPALAPRPWDDYYLGDTVQLYARDGALSEAASVRVNAFTWVVDEHGNEAAAIPDPQTPDEANAIQALLAVEVTT